MSSEKKWSKSNWLFVLGNFIAAGVLFVLMVVVALFVIDSYTHHGEVATVPDLSGRYTEEAGVILAQEHIRFQVIDSVYVRNKALGSIVEQTPPAGTIIKKNSTIYLTLNSRSIRQVTIPELRDMSLRQAEATVKTIGLKVGNITYNPSEYNNLVLDVRHKGVRLRSGAKLPERSSIDFTVGVSSEAGVPTLVPDLIGLTIDGARTKILDAQMTVGAIKFDVPPTGNESEYIVYSQSIKSGSWENVGKSISISLSLDRSRVLESVEVEQEEDFF